MSDPRTAAPSLDERRYALERERFALESRRLALEESWPRKWGSVLVSAAATLSVAIITAGVGLIQSRASQQAAARTDTRAQLQRDVDNDRTALDMYFKYIADKPESQPHKADHIQLIESIASNRKMLERLGSQQTRAALDTRTDQTPSVAAAGLPDLQRQSPGHQYTSQDFTSYVQFYQPRGADVDRVVAALRELGLRVPPAQAIPPSKSPNKNWVWYYRPAHAAFAQRLAADLGRTTGFPFGVRSIATGRLPDGIIEVWIGKAN